MFKSVYIYGLGMMGASLAKAIKNSKSSIRVYGTDLNKKSLSYARKNNIIDDYDTNKFNHLSNSDLIIICVPMLSYKQCVGVIKKYRKSSSLITDIGSTKKSSCDIFKKNKTLGNYFCGSHPLTGKEKSSAKNYDSKIFKDQFVLLCKEKSTLPSTELKIKRFWKTLGCKTINVSSSNHDQILSMTSHLPHLISFILVDLISRNKLVGNIDHFTGGGFRDLARLAKSDVDMWANIIATNKNNILSSIDKFSKSLGKFKEKIATEDFDSISKHMKRFKHKKSKKNA